MDHHGRVPALNVRRFISDHTRHVARLHTESGCESRQSGDDYADNNLQQSFVFVCHSYRVFNCYTYLISDAKVLQLA